MSDGEGKGSRLGDIVLFASWHHNQEEEEEDVEGETEAGVSKSRYFVISISIKYSNFSRFYKKKGPFYKKFRCDKFCN